MNLQTKKSYINICVCLWIHRTYADKLSPKVVQSLLDLLCSQLKNLLSQAGVGLLSSGKDQEDNKHEDSADSEKKDLRGDERKLLSSLFDGLRSVFSDLMKTMLFCHENMNRPKCSCLCSMTCSILPVTVWLWLLLCVPSSDP